MKHRYITLLALVGLLSSCGEQATKSENSDIVFNEQENFNPKQDIMYKAPSTINVDGVLSDEEWADVPYLDDFGDIEGKPEFKPHLSTKAKITYDENYFYVAAEIETPKLWAEFTKRDDVICLENDFEVFIDFTGDTHNYLEFEMNARNTVWDLIMTKPYRDGGTCLDMVNLRDLKTAVKINGTLNDNSDVDKGWTVEIALPWQEILQARPGKRNPIPGEQFRMNFLRIEHPLEVKDGKYVKCVNPKYDKIIGDHWTWSPIGQIALHCPELYGYIQVSDKVAGKGTDEFNKKPEEDIKWLLRRLYYRQDIYKKATGSYATDLSQLKAEDIFNPEMIGNLKVYTSPSSYEITYDFNDSIWHIMADGKVWATKKQ